MHYESQEFRHQDSVAYGNMPAWAQAWRSEPLAKVSDAQPVVPHLPLAL